jgi:hypothetical protein
MKPVLFALAFLGCFFGVGNVFALVEDVFSFGVSGDLPVAGDWNGDGITNFGVYRPSSGFYLDYNGNGAWDNTTEDRFFPFGITGDQPVAGDWNADGKSEIGVWRPSSGSFWLDQNGNGAWDNGIDKMYFFGIEGDLPVSGDWNADGKSEIGIRRPSLGTFFVDYNSNGAWDESDQAYQFGATKDLPLAGDWNGDGKDEFGVWRPSGRTFYLDYNGNGAWDAADKIYSFANSTFDDIPFAGDWNADGMDEVGVYRSPYFHFYYFYPDFSNCILSQVQGCRICHTNGKVWIDDKPECACQNGSCAIKTGLTCNYQWDAIPIVSHELVEVGDPLMVKMGFSDSFGGIGVELELSDRNNSARKVNVLEARSGGGAGWQHSALIYAYDGNVLLANQAVGNSVHYQWGYNSNLLYSQTGEFNLLSADKWVPNYPDSFSLVGSSPCMPNNSGLFFDYGKPSIRSWTEKTEKGSIVRITKSYSLRSAIDQFWSNYTSMEALYLNLSAARETDLKMYVVGNGWIDGPIRPYEFIDQLPHAQRIDNSSITRTFHYGPEANYSVLVWNIDGVEVGLVSFFTAGAWIRLEKEAYCIDPNDDKCGNINHIFSNEVYQDAVFNKDSIRTYHYDYIIGTLPQLFELGYACSSTAEWNKNKACVSTCVPNQISGCRVCKADGSAWTDNSSRCPAGQTCVNGNCSASTATTFTSPSSTTSTTVQQCVMHGNYLPCGEVALTEVVNAINLWSMGDMDVGNVIDLINSWADPFMYPSN